jgi:NADH dehydrogenase
MPGSLFLTGATGYVGRHLLPRLAGRRVYCLGRTRPAALPGHAEFLAADLSEGAAYAPALRDCDTVLHLAAATGKARPEEYFRVNAEGTRRLVDECRRAGVPRFLYVSTIAAKFRDQRRYYYAQSKRQAEEIVAASGLAYLIVRPTMVMGKGAPVLEGLRRLAAAPVIPVFGNGRARVQPVSVDDLAAFLSAVPQDWLFDNQTVELGGPEVVSIEDLLLKLRGARAPVVHLPAGGIAATLGVLERFLLPLLPFTAGQIASFVNDGTAAPHPRTGPWRERMRSLDQMLA